MPAAYSRSVSFATTTDAVVCVRVPVPPRGTLTRLTAIRTGGDSVTAAFKLYDRRGACTVATDLNVTASGAVTAVANSGGKAAVSFDAAHGLYAGDTFEIKGSNVAAYNRTHVVQSVTDADTVVTDVNYTSVGTGGLWQTSPFLPTSDPSMHLVVADTVPASTALSLLELNRPYENRDNQNPVTRIAHDSLWLEFKPEAEATAATWEVGYTVHPASFII